MTAAVKGWLLSLVAAALISAVADALTPEGAAKKVERLVGGLLLLSVMIRPVSGLDLAERVGEYTPPETENQWTEELTAADNLLLERLITDSTQAYIEAQAQSLGGQCRAEVTCLWQGEVPVPFRVEVAGSLSTEQRSALSRVIRAELGIPEERQTYREEER